MAKRKYDISVVIASCRPKWLANCLAQFRQQSYGNLFVSPIVVCEGTPDLFQPIIEKFNILNPIYKEKQGKWGAYAKDRGIKECNSEYVCFWDDDNVYYPHAVATLFSVASGFDIGVVQTGFFIKDCPQCCKPTGYEKNTFDFGNIDTMCICARTILASKEKWAEHEGAGTDYAWLQKLLKHKPTIRRVNIKIGEKLVDVE